MSQSWDAAGPGSCGGHRSSRRYPPPAVGPTGLSHCVSAAVEVRVAIYGVVFIFAFFVIGLWLASIALKDSSIVDIFWGLGCAATAWIFYWKGAGAEPRATLTLILATLWGGRLGLYIGARNWGGEDRRYARLRQHITDQGRNYVLYSLRAVFLFQGIAMVICTLPLLVAIATPGDGRLGILGGIAAL